MRRTVEQHERSLHQRVLRVELEPIRLVGGPQLLVCRRCTRNRCDATAAHRALDAKSRRRAQGLVDQPGAGRPDARPGA